jgi:protein-tyrosine-phosphatase
MNNIPTSSVKRVIFVCVENSNRSQMAEAFARIHGGDRVDAFSAGSRPSGRINPKAIAAMKLKGYDLSAHESKSIDRFLGTRFDAAITMGCGDSCAVVPADYQEHWNIPDPREMSEEQFLKVRDLIEERVQALLAVLIDRS